MSNKFINRFLYWRLKHLSNRTFLILISIVIGIVSALAAVLLKILVQQLHHLSEYLITSTTFKFWYFLLPVSGILLTVLVIRIFLKGRLEKGLESILFSINNKSSRVEKSKTWSQLVTSGITVGLGGSAGLEAPIVITGSALGSNIARFFRFNYKERTLLLACGAASGIAAVFDSPIAGVIFAVEVLLIGFSIPEFIPLLISTATATIVSKLLYKGQLFYMISNDWQYHAIPFYVVLGIACGLLSVYIIRMTLGMENIFHKIKSPFTKTIAGSILLGAMIFLLPPLYGEGYSTVKLLLTGSYTGLLNHSFLETFQNNPWMVLIFASIIILVKIIATSLTTGSGGNGGIFAPSLFIGALAGFILAYGINLTGISTLHVSNFIVVGMAGILAGVIHAPLTAIFLIAEITGGYVLFVPLMIVSALSFFITKYFEPHSVYTKNLAKKGHLPGDDKDSGILKNLKVGDILETDFFILHISDPVSTLKEAFKNSRRNIFPVIDEKGEFSGIIYLEKVKHHILDQEKGEELKINSVTEKNVTIIDIDENMQSVMIKFERSGQWNIPVVKNNMYMGFISRSNILSYYRKEVKRKVSLF